MPKFAKISILVVIAALAGFLLYQQVNKAPRLDDEALEAMKQSIIADPVVNADDLNEEQLRRFLDGFQTARETVISLNFETLQGINEIALIKKTLGDLEGARIAWEYANIVRPQNSLSFANLAALYHYDLRDYELAEKNYLTAIANDPDDIPTIRNFWELYYYSLQDLARAEALLLQSIELNPEAADLYSLAGRFYQDIGRTNEAVQMYEKHLELNPGNEAVKRELEKLRQS